MVLSRIEKFFSPNSILDIGANRGQWHKLAKTIWPEAYIHSVEPNIECIKKLSKVTKNYTNALLSDSVKELTYYDYLDTGEGNSYYRERSTRPYRKIQMMSTTVDKLFKNDSFDLIKIDTQGSELDIIEGGKNLIKNTKGILLEVTHTNPWNFDAPLFDKVVQRLNALDYFPTVKTGKSGIAEDQFDVLFLNRNFNFKVETYSI